MTGPAWILAGAAIFALTYAIGLRAHTAAAEATAPPWPAESDGIYDWAHDWDQLAADELEGWQT